MLFERPSTYNESWVGPMTKNRKSQNFQPESFSTLGPAAYNRIEEWSRQNFSDQDVILDGATKNQRTFSQGSWRDSNSWYHQGNNQSTDIDPEFEDSDEVTPWDSISMVSSRNEPTYQKGSGTYGAIDDELEYQENYCATRNRNDYLQRSYSKTKTSRTAPNLRKLASQSAALNRINLLTAQGNRPEKESNNKLLSCIDSLEYLSKKLEKVTRVSSEIGKFRSASQSLGSENVERQVLLQNQPGRAKKREWTNGDNMISQRNDDERYRQISHGSTSSDSGVNFNGEYISSQFESFSTQNPSNNQRYHPVLYKPDRSLKQPHGSLEQIDENSSGYSSESNSLQKPQYTSREYFYKSNNVNPYPYSEQGHDFKYDFEDIYGSEDPYGYGTCAYASSSIYDEDLRQSDGWFYLPSHQRSSPSPFKASLPQQKLTDRVQQNFYVPKPSLYPSIRMSQNAEAAAVSYQPQLLPETAYGSLSGSFLNSTEALSPLSAAITVSCAKDYMKNETNDFGMLQNYGSTVHSVENYKPEEEKKRKSVRFSQTVQERTEKNELEVEDTTSIMKGSDNARNVESQDHCDILDISPQLRSTPFGAIAQEQPVYSYPTAHLANCGI